MWKYGIWSTAIILLFLGKHKKKIYEQLMKVANIYIRPTIHMAAFIGKICHINNGK